jgi:subtilase family serine protease
MRLAIGLPLRDPAGLDLFLAQVQDPASPHYHQFLTLDELTRRFGPTEEDYAAAKQFARKQGLLISGTHLNRLVLDLVGTRRRGKGISYHAADLPASH